MITIDKLISFGANVEEGLARCVNNEDFYLMLVNKLINDTKIDDLAKQIEDGDLANAFSTSHSLKGLYGNLSISPIYDLLVELTDYLRERKEMDYHPIINELKKKKEEFNNL